MGSGNQGYVGRSSTTAVRARVIRIADFEIAGKTGTAQVAELGKDVGDKKDHAWFVSFAPAYKPEIAVLVTDRERRIRRQPCGTAAKGVFEAFRISKGDIPPETPTATTVKPAQVD